MKTTLLLILLLQSTIIFSQDDLFPMKGDYIYYEFNEKTNNTDHCIAYYSDIIDSTHKHNNTSIEFMTNVLKKVSNMNELKFTLTGLKNVQVIFGIEPAELTDCTEEIKTPNGLKLTLPTGAMLLEDNLLFSLITSGKFKVYQQSIAATVKVKFISDNEYSLIFTNFKINYIGTKGSSAITEELDLEEVYKTLQEKGKQNDKMYDKAMETMKELDEIVKGCAKIYSEELKRTYQLDEL